MMNCAFTIVAKNYIGLALILRDSLKKNDPEIDFYIFVADEISQDLNHLEDNILECRNILGYTETQWVDMSFKYDLTEFCTSIKPACFQYLFNTKEYQKCIYFDPDIFIFSSVDIILKMLEKYDVVLTPQVSGIHINYQGEHPEWAMNVNGIFNLGFCGMRCSNTSNQVLAWWRTRLIDNAFVDRSVGNFTDQKWMDWLPGLLGNEHLYVFHHLGMNMAPWNYFERQLFYKDGKIKVKFRTDDNQYQEDDLIFLHFAGYDYQKLKLGTISRKRIENLKEYDDLSLATDVYRDAIMINAERFDRFISLPYSYGAFDNGIRIQSFHRRLYHGLTKGSAHYSFANPFSTAPNSFYSKIKQKGMIINENLDKLTKNNLPNMNKKRKMIGFFFNFIYSLIGYKRYVLFVKSLYNYCRPEWHTFLVKK